MIIVRLLLAALLLVSAHFDPAIAQSFQSIGSTSLSVSTSSGNVALPATTFGNNLIVQNVGANEAFIALGGSGVVATTGGESVPAGSARCFQLNGQLYLAGISGSSVTTLRISQGTGPCSISYRGGGGGGGGGGVSSVFGRTGDVVVQSGDYTIGQIGSLGTGAATALGVNVGSAGAVVVNGGALGAPSSGTATNLSGTAASLTVGNVTGTGVASATSLALGGATIGSNALAVTGTTALGGATSVTGASFGLSGAISSAAWTTNGVRYKNVAATLTDTTSSGTVAAAYTDVWGGNTIAASSATTFTDYFNSYFTVPVAGSNVTFTRKWALGADSLNVAGAGLASNSAVLLSGAILTGGTGTTNFPQLFIQPAGATASTNWNTNGTAIGANTASGFTGDLINLEVAGTSFMKVSASTATLSVNNVVLAGSGQLTFNARGILTSSAAGSTNLGALDVDTNASIVAQTFRSQGALAGGTADQAGKNLTVIVSPGKGTGAGGSFIVQTSPAGSTGTSVNAPVTALTIDSTGLATFAAGVVGTSFVPTSSTIPTNGTYLTAANTLAFSTNSTLAFSISSAQILSAASSSGAGISAGATSATVPVFRPNRGATTTGIGADTAGDISLIAVGVEQVRIAASGVITFPTIVSDATKTDATACIDTTSKQIYSGSGTLGVCLGTSSSRYKHDVEPLDVGLPQIMAIQPVKYRLNADHGDPNKLLYGFTAEQGGSVLPSLTGLDAQGRPNTFDYLGVVPVLVRAVQEQQKEIEQLKRIRR